MFILHAEPAYIVQKIVNKYFMFVQQLFRLDGWSGMEYIS